MTTKQIGREKIASVEFLSLEGYSERQTARILQISNMGCSDMQKSAQVLTDKYLGSQRNIFFGG